MWDSLYLNSGLTIIPPLFTPSGIQARVFFPSTLFPLPALKIPPSFSYSLITNRGPVSRFLGLGLRSHTRSAPPPPRGASGESAGATTAATVTIRCPDGSMFSVQTALDSTVGAFKVVLAGSSNIPAEQQRLAYKGLILKDDQTLKSYGVESDQTIHLVCTFAPSIAEPIIPTDNGGASRTPNSTSGVTTGSDDGFERAELDRSLFPDLDVNGLTGSGASGVIGDRLRVSGSRWHLMLTYDMVMNFLSVPAIQELMNNFSNPNLREVIDNNPDISYILNNPKILHQAIAASENPELMRAMLRNPDRARGQFGRQQPSQGQNQKGGASVNTGLLDNKALQLLLNIFGGLGAARPGAPPMATPALLKELYAIQLYQLQEMGFSDVAENIQALSVTSGNVLAAVERLLGNLGH